MSLIASVDTPFLGVSPSELLGSSRNHPVLTRDGYYVWLSQGFHSDHQAIDIAAVTGTKVYAPHSGVVDVSGEYGGCGYTVRIERRNMRSALCHLSQPLVAVGTQVRQGQLVGLSGASGTTRGSHLHWQLSISGELIDPIFVLRMAHQQAITIGVLAAAAAAGTLYLAWR